MLIRFGESLVKPVSNSNKYNTSLINFTNVEKISFLLTDGGIEQIIYIFGGLQTRSNKYRKGLK